MTKNACFVKTDDKDDLEVITSKTERSMSGLLVDQGKVTMNSTEYDIDSQGLFSYFEWQPTYAESTPYYNAGQRIAYDSSAPDAYAIIEAFCRAHAYGTRDDALTDGARETLLKSGVIYTQCGSATSTLRSILDDAGFESRQVHFLTAETPTDFDDGHVAIEVKINGSWCFFDQSGDGYWRSGQTHCSLLDLIDAGVGSLPRVILCPTECEGGSLIDSETFNPRPFFDVYLNNETKYQDWCNRIFQIPAIWDEGGTNYQEWFMPTGTESRQSWVEGLSANYSVLSRSAWIAKYYP